MKKRKERGCYAHSLTNSTNILSTICLSDMQKQVRCLPLPTLIVLRSRNINSWNKVLLGDCVLKKQEAVARKKGADDIGALSLQQLNQTVLCPR